MKVGKQIRNTTWDELQVGAVASLERTCNMGDLILFAHAAAKTKGITSRLTSRADNDQARLGSAALAALDDYWKKTGAPITATKPPRKAAE